MTTPALDLTQLDAALADLVDALGGHSLEDVMLEAGQIVQSAWRDNILSAGLVDSGDYLESIEVKAIAARVDGVRVQVSTDARSPDGEPYPYFLEYGTSDIFPHPVAQRAFDETRRAVVNEVAADVERKVRSRATRRPTARQVG